MSIKTKIILSGDLIAFPGILSKKNPAVLIISAIPLDNATYEVSFILLGEETILEGIACHHEYLLLSRLTK